MAASIILKYICSSFLEAALTRK